MHNLFEQTIYIKNKLMDDSGKTEIAPIDNQSYLCSFIGINEP